MNENGKINVGFIGVGNIVSSHLNALEAIPEMKLVSVCDKSVERLKPLIEKYSCKGFDDYHEFLNDPPDVVLVALPHGLHCQVTLEAFQAGCHVLVEKPMAVSAEECRKMLESSKKQQKHLLDSVKSIMGKYKD